MPVDIPLEQPFPRPLSGASVETLPSALIPARAPLRGKHVELVPQNAALHAPDLFAAGHESEQALKTWEYLAYGPWASVADYRATMIQEAVDNPPPLDFTQLFVLSQDSVRYDQNPRDSLQARADQLGMSIPEAFIS